MRVRTGGAPGDRSRDLRVAPQAGRATGGGDLVRGTIERANAEERAALVCYLPAGYPDLDVSETCLRAAAAAGADVLEVGFPFSDPVIDGPIIQAANQAALEQGISVDDDLALCARLTASVDVPTLLMTYYTIPAARGLDTFAADAAAVGLAGAILPDLPAEEAGDWLDRAAAHGLSTVFLAAPTSSEARLDAIAAVSSGFVYATSVLGVTGVRDSLADARQLVERIRERTDLPVAVGIGVSSPEQAQEVATYADGVIVGSALVRAVGDGDPTSAHR
ncbi:MAG: tryptophan synthase subunit alpha, partial [Actinomycetota bacterium]|nr:tryptophan synthase subunit alpha [Actinomycetota bacterium]